ncbi:hypothetical protein [Carboxylicivirga caseinilyticus]|uniref:hypothetical protein n=1 Tax=Carboxylicivirga caseinilyticus TaxID=3417572 RepID=UPI003D32DDE5|nr:hypothetical protein [Marinilabiliaceae bacterium A049]
MTKKDFFILIIKLFGLYSVITSAFITIPQNISLLMMDFNLVSLIFISLAVAIPITLFVFLIFKSHRIARMLKLEQGFDTDTLELGKLNSNEIVKIAVLIIGGIMILNNLPHFIFQSVSWFQSEMRNNILNTPDNWKWFVSGFNITIGYLLITNVRLVVKILNYKTKKLD